MALRMDNVGIVVEDLEAAIEFFRELGLELELQTVVEGEWAGRVTGLGDQRVEIAMMSTPDGHGRLELSLFLEPQVIADHRNAPVNALGYLRVMFAVDDIDETLARLLKHGARLGRQEEVSAIKATGGRNRIIPTSNQTYGSPDSPRYLFGNFALHGSACSVWRRRSRSPLTETGTIAGTGSSPGMSVKLRKPARPFGEQTSW